MRPTALTLAASLLAVLAGCSTKAGKSNDDCPDGICLGGEGGGVGNGGGGGAGNAGTGNAAGSTQNGGGGTGGKATGGKGGNGGVGGGGSGGKATGGTGGSVGNCTESWSCTPWETSGAGNSGTRSCTDANKCGTTRNKPGESATLPALNFNYFKCQVAPVLQHTCGQLGCHGTERPLRVFHRGGYRMGTEIVNLRQECLKDPKLTTTLAHCVGSIECECWMAPKTTTEWRRNYDSARGFALDANLAPIASAQADTSELIAQPIAGGGRPHAGIHPIRAGGAEHTVLKQWLGGATLGSCNTTD